MTLLPLEGAEDFKRVTRNSPPGIYVRVYDDGSEGGRYRQTYDTFTRVRADNSYVNTVINWQGGIRNTLGFYRRIE